MDYLETLRSLGAIVAAVGGIVGTAWGLLKILGTKWLDEKFSKRLESFRHVQQQELAHLKFRIDTLFDRNVKLHEREFNALPEIWSKLIDAFHPAQQLVSPIQTYPDLDLMAPAVFEDFLSRADLPYWQKEELRGAQKKVSYYARAIERPRYNRARSLLREFDLALLKDGVFIPGPLAQKFEELGNCIFEALTEWELNLEMEAGDKKHTHIGNFRKNGDALLRDLGGQVRERLWSSAVSDAAEGN